MTDRKPSQLNAAKKETLRGLFFVTLKEVDGHDFELTKGNTTFAVIKTKLNFVIAIMSFLGAALGGYLVLAMFQ